LNPLPGEFISEDAGRRGQSFPLPGEFVPKDAGGRGHSFPLLDGECA